MDASEMERISRDEEAICKEKEDETKGNVCQQSENEDETSLHRNGATENVFKLPSSKLSFSFKTTATKSTDVPDESRPPAAVKSVATTQKTDGSESIKEKEKDVVQYKEPSWSGIPTQPYSFEVLKGGVVVGTVDLSDRPYTVCGRLPACHIVMEHPSVSRYHAVIQYRSVASEDEEGQNGSRPSGFYVYDLGSTHGTFLNKNHQLKPRCYYPMHVGHMIKFGGSSRVYLLQGPEDDQEEESPLTVTQLKELGKSLEAAEIAKKANVGEQKKEERETVEEDTGIDWGMGEDAVEEETPDMAINPFALDGNALDDSSYAEDPKKTLRGWFEREGYDLDYEVEEKGQAQFLCRIRLPIDNPTGGPVYVEALVKGKKKEAVAACALEACRTLDRRGVLRRATHESRQKKKRNWEEDDFYNSDEDTYLDRTGTVERKRKQRIQRAGKEKDRVETYETLMEKHAQITEKILQTETTLSQGCKHADEVDGDEQDALDAYMKTIAGGDDRIDKKEKSRLKVELRLLRDEAEKLRRLVEIARPTSLPPVNPVAPPSETNDTFRPKQYGLIKISHDNFKMPNSKETLVAKQTIQQSDEPINIPETVKDGVSVTGEPLKKLMSCAGRPTMSESHECDPTQEGRLSPNQIVTDEVTVPKEDSETRKAEVDAPKRQKGNRKHKEKLTKYEYDKSNPNYAMWLPPNDQSGDGKTNLNDKYGY